MPTDRQKLARAGVTVVQYVEVLRPSVRDHRYLLKGCDESGRRVASAWGRTVQHGLRNLLDAVTCTSNPLVFRYAKQCPTKMRRSAEVS